MYIFLDIDGVLNTESSWRLKPYDINKTCLENFVKICDKDTKIILSSTWKKGFKKNLEDCTEQVKALRLALQEFGIDIYDVTPERNGDREQEILRYIGLGVSDYIIIDDDKSLFPTGSLNTKLCLINCKTGFTAADIQKAQKIMNGSTETKKKTKRFGIF